MNNNKELFDIEERIIELTIKNNRDRQEVVLAYKIAMNEIQPMNLIKSSLQDLISTPGLGKALLTTGLGMAANYVSHQIANENEKHQQKSTLGTILQVGISALTSENPQNYKSIGLLLIKSLINKN
jgi:hypothetical protein